MEVLLIVAIVSVVVVINAVSVFVVKQLDVLLVVNMVVDHCIYIYYDVANL
jgi:hypothetical protein